MHSTFTFNFPISALHMYERNPRKIDARAIEAVQCSIQRNGALDPIEADEEGVVLSGHTRLLAARALGLDVFPVVQHFGMDAVQKKAYRIAANKTAEYSKWDDELLRVELEDIEVDLSNAGIDISDELIEEMTGIADLHMYENVPQGGNEPEHDKGDGNVCPRCKYAW